MREIREVLRLKFEARLSHERIAGVTGISKGAVTKYVQRAQEQGLGWPLPADLDDSRLPCSVKAQESLRRPPRPGFDVANCDIKAACSVAVRRNMKSSGKRSALRFTASLSRPVLAP
jgi:hypothetical protein